MVVARPPRARSWIVMSWIVRLVPVLAVLGAAGGAFMAFRQTNDHRVAALASIPAHLERLGFPIPVEPPADGSWVWATPGRPSTAGPLIVGLWRSIEGWRLCSTLVDGAVQECRPVEAHPGLDPGIRVVATATNDGQVDMQVVPFHPPVAACDSRLLAHVGTCDEVARIKIGSAHENPTIAVGPARPVELPQVATVMFVDVVDDLALAVLAPLADGDPYGLLALDAHTGTERWRVRLPLRGPALSFAGFASLGRDLIVAHGGALTRLDPRTGALRGVIGPLAP
jgi:hypothetical protein